MAKKKKLKEFWVPVCVTFSGEKRIQASSEREAIEIVENMTRREILGEYKAPYGISELGICMDIDIAEDEIDVEEVGIE